MAIETALAKGALDRASRRDPEKIYHRMSPKELVRSRPNFGWDVYLEGIGVPKPALSMSPNRNSSNIWIGD